MTLFKVYNLIFRVSKIILYENRPFYRRYCSQKAYKVLFFGSDSISLSSFKKINELRKHEKVIERLDLVTANQSKNLSEIEEYAQSEEINRLSWPLKDIKPAEYDIGLIVAFGHLITKELLNKFPLGMVNVHPSLLPRWRGAAPIIYTLMYGDEITGVTLMKIEPDKFDVGDIICQQCVEISKDIKRQELTEYLSELGAYMLVDCMRTLPHCLNNAVYQTDIGATYAKKINKSISEVRWDEMSAVQVYNLYRALDGIYPLTTKFRDKQIKLFEAFIDHCEGMTEDNSKCVGEFEYCEKKSAVKVLCGDRQYVYFKSIRIVGKRQISALDFFNGYINV